MTEQRVSSRYARAILQSAIQEGNSDKIYEDFQDVFKVVNESNELRTLTASPVFQIWKKKKIYEEIFKDHVSDLTFKFIIMLLDKRRGELILSIIKQYESQYNKLNNRLTVDIFTAIEPTEEIKNKITNALTEWTKKVILPQFTVKADLKGGIIIKISDWVFDASIKHQLELLYKELVNTRIN
jgi:F-type H+-transporting ATPase subunit delta